MTLSWKVIQQFPTKFYLLNVITKSGNCNITLQWSHQSWKVMWPVIYKHHFFKQNFPTFLSNPHHLQPMQQHNISIVFVIVSHLLVSIISIHPVSLYSISNICFFVVTHPGNRVLGDCGHCLWAWLGGCFIDKWAFWVQDSCAWAMVEPPQLTSVVVGMEVQILSRGVARVGLARVMHPPDPHVMIFCSWIVLCVFGVSCCSYYPLGILLQNPIILSVYVWLYFLFK